MNGETSNEGVDRRVILLAWGAALVAVFFWALAFVRIRDAGEDLSPGALCLAGVALSQR